MKNGTKVRYDASVRRIRSTFTAFATFFALTGALAQQAQVERTIEEYMEATRTPGMAVAIVRGDRVLFRRGFGMANKELAVPVTPETVFEIGSVTKMFTAVSILMLVEEGRVDLDVPVSTYLGEEIPEQYRNLPLRQLLTHTSGAVDYLATFINQRKDYALSEVLSLVEKPPLEFPPGTSWSYSNTGYFLAGLVIEKVANMKYGEFLEQRILAPLKMTSTRMATVAELVPRRASGYVPFDKTFRNSEILRTNAGWAAGALLSSADDMVLWARALLQRKLLKPAAYEQMWAPAALRNDRVYPYGLGWMLHTRPYGPIIEHGGNTYGQSAHLALFPRQNLAVIVLANIYGQSYTHLAERLAALVDPAIKTDPPTRQRDPDRAFTFRMHDALRDAIRLRRDSPLLDEELIGLMRSRRGVSLMMGLSNAFGKLRALRFVSMREEGVDRVYRYEGVFARQTVGLDLHVTREGKLARFTILPPADESTSGPETPQDPEN